MQTNKTFGPTMLTTTAPSKIGAQADSVFDQVWRPLQWAERPLDERMQMPQNDHSLITLLDTLPLNKVTLTHPALAWRVENRLGLTTTLAQAMSATDTYISVDEPALAQIGWNLGFALTGQSVRVEDIDSDLSNGWTNDAGKACNVKISRNTPGPSVAALIGAHVQPMLPMLGEKGEPKKGISMVPGDPLFNYCKWSSIYIEMTKVEHNSLLAGDYGTHEHLMTVNRQMISEMLQADIILSIRGNRVDSDEGMVYSGNGILAQIESNVLNAGFAGNALTYRDFSDFIDGTFETANSSATKHIVAGENSFMNIANSAQQEAKITEEIHYNPAIGIDEFQMKTGGGKIVTIAKHRFAMHNDLADSAIVLDLGLLEMGEFKGFEGWSWQMDLNANTMAGMMVKTDAILGSYGVYLKDPDAFGFMRGKVSPRIKNRNGLGIVG